MTKPPRRMRIVQLKEQLAQLDRVFCHRDIAELAQLIDEQDEDLRTLCGAIRLLADNYCSPVLRRVILNSLSTIE